MIYELIEGGRPPVTPRDGDAGYDVFARLSDGLKIDGVPSVIPGGPSAGLHLPRFSTAVIPLGFRAALPKGYHADLRARSSWSSRGVHVSLGLIDEGYRGEWAAVVTPTCEGGVNIEHGAKIGQFVLRLTYIDELVEGDVDVDTDRGEGGFGSTGDGRLQRAIEAVDDAIDAWHESDTRLPLHEYLGMSEQKYEAFVKNPADTMRAYVPLKLRGEDPAKIERIANSYRKNSLFAASQLKAVADAIGYDDESGMSIADRGAELLDGARKMENLFDSIALTLGLSQGLDEGHVDYVRRVAGAVRALRDEHEILKGRTTHRHPTASS